MCILDFILLSLAFGSAFFILQVIEGSKEKEERRRILNERIERLSKQQDLLLESENIRISTFSKLETGGLNAALESQHGIIDRIKILMKKGGVLNMTITGFVSICLLGGIGVTFLIIYFDVMSPIFGIPVGIFSGAYLIYSALCARADKRKLEFLQQFPDAIDMLIRGVKAGLTIGRSIKLVSMEAKDPLASEFEIISQKFELGVGPEKVLQDAAEKLDIEEFRFLVVALVLQMENGGVIAEILGNLSNIVRKRLELGLKIKALSAEARMSAAVISALPFIFAAIMALVNPSHLQEFLTPGTGQTLLKTAVILFLIGTFMMFKATKVKV